MTVINSVEINRIEVWVDRKFASYPARDRIKKMKGFLDVKGDIRGRAEAFFTEASIVFTFDGDIRSRPGVHQQVLNILNEEAGR